ncbi:MAG: SusD/RagB family nutrient-binding outer membrane lipoprotein [Bacteroidales bacterium]|nr:SusD/RagB family nutrient-binding outer membrane lipoprotein [Bacteroidales bacterium]
MKKFISSILLVSSLFAFSGCDKYLDVNTNQDAPDRIDAYLYLAGIQSAYADYYYDLRALCPLSQMMGTTSYSTFANNYYSKASDAGGQIWRMSYWEQGMNLENMINQAKDAEEWTLAGIGLAMKAFSWDMITKYHGEAPMTQAYEAGRLAHDYDYQPEIMAQVRAWAEEAISLLEMEDATDYGSRISANDLVYKGNKEKWLKFAHSIIVTDLAALTRKSDFKTAYYPALVEHAAAAIDDNDSNFTVERCGGGADAQYSAYNNFWGVYRDNLSTAYFQSDFVVQMMTGQIRKYDETTADFIKKYDSAGDPINGEYELLDQQIICDTVKAAGHYDPRMAAKLSTKSGRFYHAINEADSVMRYEYIGGSFISRTSPDNSETTPNLYGWTTNVGNVDIDGTGRWLFRDEAPYILLTAAEIQFELAEAHWVAGDKAAALDAFKKGVALDEEFTCSYLNPGSPVSSTDATTGEVTYTAGGAQPGGSMISKTLFNTLAEAYVAGPYVGQLTTSTLTLSHIMMQKYVALWPWGGLEAWTDLRKYNYDIPYSGDYPTKGNGWDKASMRHKWDTDPTKIYKGLYLAPMDVEGRRSAYNNDNDGSPCYRVRPRYNSEYMWNKASLSALSPISGTADNYHCSKPWFVYPGDYPAAGQE